MLGSPILDVAIGMAFIYLLLSLIASAAQEILASIIQSRSANLERGLRSMLSNDNATVSGGQTFVAALYNHGLVRGLYQKPSKDYHENAFRKFTRTTFGGVRLFLRFVLGMKVPGQSENVDLLLLPAYIPSRVFAMAMRDILSRPMPADPQAGTPGGPPPGPGTAMPVLQPQTEQAAQPADADIQAAAGAEAQEQENAAMLQRAKAESVAENAVARPAVGAGAAAGAAAGPSPEDLKMHAQILSNLQSLVNQQKSRGPDGGDPENNLAAEALLALVKDSGGNAQKLQSNLENWYNDTMDRVSGWYKRYVQNVLLVIGLVLAIVFNVDSLRLGQALWLDKDARAGLGTAAGYYLQTHSNAPPASSGNTSMDSKQLSDNLQGTVDTFNLVAKKSLIPVGWRYDWAQYRASFSAEPWQELLKRLLPAIFGWIITAIALSYGAPFWFDTLNKFMVVRSTVKPQEKSQNEGSKA